MDVLFGRIGTRAWRPTGIVLLACCGAGLLGASGALAETKSFTKQGCELWKVPAGVSKVSIQATGAAGEHAIAGTLTFAGLGDGYSAALSGLSAGEELDVCVDVGGGGGGLDAGSGGGASGVSSGTNFEHPVLVAGGGGGAGTDGFEEEGAGGNAGEAGHLGREIGAGGGGGAGTSKTSGEGGAAGAAGQKGGNGEAFSATGPGHGGAGASSLIPNESSGGGGGAGYYGGGGGGNALAAGGGGGGGGSDFCGNGTTSCEQHAKAGTKHEAGEAEGDAKVTLTYTVLPATTLTTSLSGEGKEGEKITVKQGAAVTDRATLSGENASTATGTATYNVYGDSGCTKLLGTVSSAVSGGKSETSPLTFVEAGTYYWRVSYSGDENNQGSEDTCGAEVLTVTPKPSTCGKTTIGKSSDALLSNLKRVNKCVLPNATVTELSTYLAPTSTKGQQLIKGIIYADAKGNPGARLGVTEQLTFKSTSAPGWYRLVFPTPVKVEAGTYWIGLITGTTSKVAGERYDAVKNAEDYNANSYTSGPSNPFGSFKTTNEEMSLYATFTPEQQTCAPTRLSVC